MYDDSAMSLFMFDILSCHTCFILKGQVYVPSFDHGVGDPVEDDIFVSLQ